MIRSDHLGVTSIIRTLGLRPSLYETMMHFFRASSWDVGQVRQRWVEVVKEYAPVRQKHGYTILIGDGVKQAKEARYMPGVKKLFQESENSSTPHMMFGHMFGGLGVLVGNSAKYFCLPLSIRLHDGLQFLHTWNNAPGIPASHVVQMVDDGFRAARTFGPCVLLLDRYFLSVPALQRLAQLNAGGSTHMEIVTKAKQTCVAYEMPEEKKGRGRPRKRGNRVKLKDLFADSNVYFHKATLELYGKQTPVEFCHVDLLWGEKLYQKLRFVLVKYGNTRSILVSTCLELSPREIICLYGYRFRIEGCFREFKQQLGGLFYHFWTRAMPKLNRFKKKDTPDPALEICNEKQRRAVCQTIQAVEKYVALSCIAMGILQMIALKFSLRMDAPSFRYLRTYSGRVVSEATVMCFLRLNIFRLMALRPDLSLTRLILAQSDDSDSLGFGQAA